MKFKDIQCYVGHTSYETEYFGELEIPVVILQGLGECVFLHYYNTILNTFEDWEYNHIKFSGDAIARIVSKTEDDFIVNFRSSQEEDIESKGQHIFVNEHCQQLWDLLEELDFPYHYRPVVDAQTYDLYVEHNAIICIDGLTNFLISQSDTHEE